MSTDKPTGAEQLGSLADLVTGKVWIREFLFANKRNLVCCPTFMTEYSVPRPRLYRFDLALPSLMIALEYEGGVGRGDVGHTSIAAIKRDIEKSRLAAMLGWAMLRFHADEVSSGLAARVIQDLSDLRRWQGVEMGEFYRPTSKDALIRNGMAVSWGGEDR